MKPSSVRLLLLAVAAVALASSLWWTAGTNAAEQQDRTEAVAETTSAPEAASQGENAPTLQEFLGSSMEPVLASGDCPPCDGTCSACCWHEFTCCSEACDGDEECVNDCLKDKDGCIASC